MGGGGRAISWMVACHGLSAVFPRNISQIGCAAKSRVLSARTFKRVFTPKCSPRHLATGALLSFRIQKVSFRFNNSF